MKKIYLALMSLLIFPNSFAQPFQSIFGDTKTTFQIFLPISCENEASNYLGCGITEDFTTTSKDTITHNGLLYQILSGGICVREDTLTGRIYRYFREFNQDFLICDMSLNVGDTFQLPLFADYYQYCYYEQGYNAIVKQIDTIDDRKLIEFHPISSPYASNSFYSIMMYEWLKEKNIYLKFIEGIGPIYGPFGYLADWGIENYLGVLLCVEREDSLYYMTSELLGCYQFGTKIDEIESQMIKIYPNPTNEIIHLEIDGDNLEGQLYILNSNGMIMFQKKIQENKTEITISHLSDGFYSVLYETSQKRVMSKFIKIK